MSEEKPNQMVQHLLRMVTGREQAEVAKLALLGEISSKAGEILGELKSVNAQLGELLERARER